ncbi:MAG: RagB/SusD family nutrient uptake outer membrane protein [Flavobacteriaceae bacterium]|nr:RagB/SusD family nutrient uptake outer membrane protein [Flavobacteriaceae bacterium]
MMKNFIKYLFTIATVIFIGGCDLEEELTGQYTEPNTVAGSEDKDIPLDNSGGQFDGQIVNDDLEGAFAKLRDGTAGHNGYWSIVSVGADDLFVGQKGGDWFDGGTWLQIHRHTNNATHEGTNNAWGATYGAINEANNVLSRGGLSDNEVSQLKVLRAFFYWRLLDTWGRVKLITTPGQDVLQSSRSEVFNFVEKEVLDALGINEVSASMDLTNSPLTTNDRKYRVNQFAALALLTRLYLNAEVYTGTAMYQQAVDAATYIIDNGPYTLSDENYSIKNLAKRTPDAATATAGNINDPDNLTGYAAVFAPNNQNNPEIIWSVNFASNLGGMNFAQMTLHYASQTTFNLANQPWNGYQTVTEFYGSYARNDRRLSNFLEGPQYDYAGRPLIDWAADDYSDTGAQEVDVNYTPFNNELEPNACRQCGVRMYKFSFRQFQQNDMDNDFPLFRLGEVYMNRGEARARATGDWSQSLSDINMIRRRAGVPEYTSISAEEYLAERGREFYQEALRRTDMIRFGNWGDTWWEKDSPSEPFRTLFPIPQGQIDASNNTLTQNPGY